MSEKKTFNTKSSIRIPFRLLVASPILFLLLLSLPARAQIEISILLNGGFESGPPAIPWQETSSRGRTLVEKGGSDGGPHSGVYHAKLGGSNNEQDRIFQDSAMPDGAAWAGVSFWYKVETTGSDPADGDSLIAQLSFFDETPSRDLLLTGASNSSGWVYSDYIGFQSAEMGRPFRLSFEATTDKNQPTTFYVDDVAVLYVPGNQTTQALTFVNPISGCRRGGPGPQPDSVVVSGVVPVSVIAFDWPPPKELSLSLGGKKIASRTTNRLESKVNFEPLTTGSSELQATAITRDGTIRFCPITVTPRAILHDPSFERGSSSPDWIFSTNQANHALVISSTSPLPLSGDYCGRLGGTRNAHDSFEQLFKVPADMVGGSLSFYDRVIATSTNSIKDTFSVQLIALDGSVTETLLQLNNTTVTGNDYELRSFSIPETLIGKACRLLFSANITSNTPTSFVIDDIGIWIQSQTLATATYPGTRALLDPTTSSPCLGQTLTALTDFVVEKLWIEETISSNRTVVATQLNTTSLPILVRTTQNECKSYAAIAETPTLIQRSSPVFFAGGSTLCSTDTTRPTAVITGMQSGQTVRGIIPVAASGFDNLCLKSTAILLDGKEIRSRFGSSASMFLDTRLLTNGSHLLQGQAVDVAGNTNFLSGSSISFSVDNLAICDPDPSHDIHCTTKPDVTPFMPSTPDFCSQACQSSLDFNFDCNYFKNCLARSVGRIWNDLIPANTGSDQGWAAAAVYLGLDSGGHPLVLTSGQAVGAASTCTESGTLKCSDHLWVNFPYPKSVDTTKNVRRFVTCGITNCANPVNDADRAKDWAILELEAAPGNRQGVDTSGSFSSKVATIGFGSVFAGSLADPETFFQIDYSQTVGSITYPIYKQSGAGWSIGATSPTKNGGNTDPIGSALFSYDGKLLGVASDSSGDGSNCHVFAVSPPCTSPFCPPRTCSYCSQNIGLVNEFPVPPLLYLEWSPFHIDFDPVGTETDNFVVFADGVEIKRCGTGQTSDSRVQCQSEGFNFDSRALSTGQLHTVSISTTAGSCSSLAAFQQVVPCNLTFMPDIPGYINECWTTACPPFEVAKAVFRDGSYTSSAGSIVRAKTMDISVFQCFDTDEGPDCLFDDGAPLVWNDHCDDLNACNDWATFWYPPAPGNYDIQYHGWSENGCPLYVDDFQSFSVCASIITCDDYAAISPAPFSVSTSFDGETKTLLADVIVGNGLVNPTVIFKATGPFSSQVTQSCASSNCHFALDVSGYPTGTLAYTFDVSADGNKLSSRSFKIGI